MIVRTTRSYPAGTRRSFRLATRWILPVLVCVGLGACSYPTRNIELDNLNPRKGYRYAALAGGEMEDTLLIVTASGGGTRAAALTLSTLRGLQQLTLPSGQNLAEEIDVMSSVSGGSVTAAFFALAGPAGFDRLEHSFIRKDGITEILWRGLNPVGLASLATPSTERIDLLIDYLDESLFDNKTFEHLRIIGKRPFLILNAGDMGTGTPFPFTQERFDLMCSDLSQLKLSVGVAASAAFPGALSPVTLVNYSPCPSQNGDRWPPRWVTNAAEGTSWYDNPSRVRRGRAAAATAKGRSAAPPDGRSYIHLLDGGIADNLGVSEPFRLLSTNDVSPNFFNQISRGKIKRIVFILVNARSAKPSRLDSDIATPSILDMLSATINASIDNATFGSFERLNTLLNEELKAAAADMPPELAKNFKAVKTYFAPVDFDAIEDAACRGAFQSIATSWTLPEAKIDALLEIGKALLKAGLEQKNLVKDLSLNGTGTLPDVVEVCGQI